MESLEQRTLMAGDVVAEPSLPAEPFPDDVTTNAEPASAVLEPDGTLRVFGTANDDYIMIAEGMFQENQWDVIGQPGIQITIKDSNGQTLLDTTYLFPSYQFAITAIEVYAGEGNDMVENNTAIASMLFGGLGDDTLYGGSGNDEIHGEAGDDGLFGGAGGFDFIDPGTGDDRFLFVDAWNNYTWGVFETVASSQTLITLHDAPAASINYDEYPGQPVTFQPGEWSLNEVKAIDQVLMVLHHRLGNASLLRDATGDGLSIHRTGHQNPHVSGVTRIGVNDNGEIYVTSGAFELGPNWVAQNLLHEIGHNWDAENPQWDAFKQLSGWTDVNPNDPNYTMTDNGAWWYLTSAAFARAYGRDDPFEDFATSFEAYFMDAMGMPYQGAAADGNNPVGAAAIPEKIAFIDNWLFGISSYQYASADDFPSPEISKQSGTFGNTAMRAGGTNDSTLGRFAASNTLLLARDSAAASYLLHAPVGSHLKRLSSDTLAETTAPDAFDQAVLELFGEALANQIEQRG